jgi:hypothetical protein
MLRYFWVLLAVALPGRAAIQPVAVPSLIAIPDSAELICYSTRAGEKSEFGQLSNELYACAPDGLTLTRITHHRKLYNHFAVSPDRKMIAAGRMDHGDTNGNGRIEERDRKTLVVLDLEHRRCGPLCRRSTQRSAAWTGH